MKLLRNIFGRRVAPVDMHAALLQETHRERVMTDEALRSLGGSAEVPVDLQLRLRLAVSHERVRAERRWTGRMAHRWHLLRENTFRAIPMQGAVFAASLLVVVLGMGVTLGAITPQQAVEANDIPLLGFSAPRYLYATGAARAVASADQAPLMVEARVSSTGHVYDYRVIRGTLTPATEAALRERMLGSVFKPASFFGEPVRGAAVLTFADVEVHG